MTGLETWTDCKVEITRTRRHRNCVCFLKAAAEADGKRHELDLCFKKNTVAFKASKAGAKSLLQTLKSAGLLDKLAGSVGAAMCRWMDDIIEKKKAAGFSLPDLKRKLEAAGLGHCVVLGDYGYRRKSPIFQPTEGILFQFNSPYMRVGKEVMLHMDEVAKEKMVVLVCYVNINRASRYTCGVDEMVKAMSKKFKSYSSMFAQVEERKNKARARITAIIGEDRARNLGETEDTDGGQYQNMLYHDLVELSVSYVTGRIGVTLNDTLDPEETVLMQRSFPLFSTYNDDWYINPDDEEHVRGLVRVCDEIVMRRRLQAL